MGFALGHKGNEGGVNGFIVKIDKMGNLTLVPNDQLFKIMYVGFNAFILQGFGIFGTIILQGRFEKTKIL